MKGDRRGIGDRSRWAMAGALALVFGVAAFLRCWQLAENGYGRSYYAAGVKSQLMSWHNLLFNAFDPAGFVSIDKPPVAIWMQVLSAKLIGFSGHAILMAQVVAGLLSILLLFVIVRRTFGSVAGLVAATLLALTPAAVAVDRSNNTESWLILVLLGAVWATLTAIDTGKRRLLVLAMVLIGIGFNIKMVAAWALAPVLLATYLLSAGTTAVRGRLPLTIAAGLVAYVVSLSWVALYDLTPKHSRPYAGGTATNSMLELMLHHNGLKRFVRTAELDNRTTSPQRAKPTAPAAPMPKLWDDTPTGPLRLLRPLQAGQFAWWLPMALVGLWLGWRNVAGRATELVARRAAVVTWTGWLLVYSLAFSFAGGVFHTYYLAVLAPPCAALAGIAVAALAPSADAGPGLGVEGGGSRGVLDGSPRSDFGAARPAAGDRLRPALLALTAAWQATLVIGQLGIDRGSWIVWLAGGCLVVVGSALLAHRFLIVIAAASLSLLVLPAVCAASVVVRRPNVAAPVASLAGYHHQPAAALHLRRAELIAASREKLLAFLSREHKTERYVLAVPNAHIAAPLILASGKPVMTLGGYTGSDPILTLEQLGRLVSAGELRFIMIGGYTLSAERSEHESAIATWTRTNGRPVDPVRWRLGASRPRATFTTEIGGQLVTMDSPELYDLRK